MTSRAWLRLFLFWLSVAGCILGYLFLLNLRQLNLQSPTAGVIPVLLLAIVTLWLNYRFLRGDGLSLASIGLDSSRHRPLLLGLGFLGGSLLTISWVVIVTLTTGAEWHVNPAFRGLALFGAVAFAFFNNAAEELTYRGYAFVRLADGINPAVAVLVTTALFALLHVQAGIPWLNVLAGVVTSGLIFGVIFARWRSLPLALGFHLATNVVQVLSGLRTSEASYLMPTYPPDLAPSGMHTALAGTALLNIVVALGIWVIGGGVGKRQANSA